MLFDVITYIILLIVRQMLFILMLNLLSGVLSTEDLYGTMGRSCVDNMVVHGGILPDDIVVDLGSGIGNVCYYFSPLVSKCIGYEMNEIRYNISKKLFSTADLEQYPYKKYVRAGEYEPLNNPIPPNVEFHHQDFLTLYHLDATVIVAHSTGWSKETLDHIVRLAKSSPSVRLLISQKQVPLPSELRIECDFNWSGSNSFIKHTMKAYTLAEPPKGIVEQHHPVAVSEEEFLELVGSDTGIDILSYTEDSL